MRVELAVCKLLLGRRQEAEAELCLSADAPQPPDPAVQEFILVRPSPNPISQQKWILNLRDKLVTTLVSNGVLPFLYFSTCADLPSNEKEICAEAAMILAGPGGGGWGHAARVGGAGAVMAG